VLSCQRYLWWKSGLRVWLQFIVGKVVLVVLTPDIFSHSCCFTVLSIGLKDFKVGRSLNLGHYDTDAQASH
jgi:hypothetical protein